MFSYSKPIFVKLDEVVLISNIYKPDLDWGNNTIYLIILHTNSKNMFNFKIIVMSNCNKTKTVTKKSLYYSPMLST